MEICPVVSIFPKLMIVFGFIHADTCCSNSFNCCITLCHMNFIRINLSIFYRLFFSSFSIFHYKQWCSEYLCTCVTGSPVWIHALHPHQPSMSFLCLPFVSTLGSGRQTFWPVWCVGSSVVDFECQLGRDVSVRVFLMRIYIKIGGRSVKQIALQSLSGLLPVS